MPDRTILVAEDDDAIREIVCDALRAKDYHVIEAADGREAFEQLLRQPVDLALLDINMPEIDGFQLLQLIERECTGTPTIMVSARGEEPDRVKGLEGGADDYITKPFSIAELTARVNAVLRRYPHREVTLRATLCFPGGALAGEARQLQFDDGSTEKLSDKEFELLRYLLTHPDRIISQEELLVRIWGSQTRASQTRTVAVTLARLKEKIRPAAAALIENVRGRGYIWKKQS